MTDATHMEARLMGLSKRRSKDGDWFEIRIQVHPKDMPSELYAVELGTRIGVALVQIAEDETELPAARVAVQKQKFADMPPSQQAGIRCNDPAFREWIFKQPWASGWLHKPGSSTSEVTAELVRHACRVESRSELDKFTKPKEAWIELNAQFEADTHLPEQR